MPNREVAPQVGRRLRLRTSIPPLQPPAETVTAATESKRLVMAQNRSRASLSANQHGAPTSVLPKHSPKRPQQRHQCPRRDSMQTAHSPSATPTRPVSMPRDERDGVKATRTPDPRLDVGMTPQERYYKNLRVLRRRDPHIVSIFDQFAHVTVYYMLDDLNMERAGYEGTLFFFERDIEPRYGLFILNRQGMNDYIRYLLHDDVFEVMGDAVWISTLSPTSRNAMGDEDKTTGFWTLATDARETLGDMMMRLAPYIRRGERYPDEFRYGPDRAVPQQNYVPGGTRDDAKHDFLRDLPEGMREKIIQTVQTAKAKAHGEEDRYGVNGGNNIAGSKSCPSTQSNSTELDQLFSKLAASKAPHPDPIPPTPTATQQSLTGKALLDTMFASVSPPAQPTGGGQRLTLQQLGLAPPVSPRLGNMEIISPKPSTAGLPQILTTDVLDELMGLPSSDSRSASRSSTSASYVDQPRSPSSGGACRSKERGYVADFGEDDGGTSETSTSIDLGNHQSKNILECLLPTARTSFLGTGDTTSAGSLKGDATPRARAEQLGHTSPPIGSHPNAAHTLSAGDKKPGTQLKAASRTTLAPSTVRIPFQSAAELWPNSGTSDVMLVSGTDVSSDVVELDFNDIEALDDIAFQAKVNNHTVGLRGREAKGKDKIKTNGMSTTVNGFHAKSSGTSSVMSGKEIANVKRERERKGTKTTVNPTQVTQVALQGDVRQDVVARSLHAALVHFNLLSSDGQVLGRNAFVREVLTLIHTDSKFVDKMYQVYQETVTEPT